MVVSVQATRVTKTAHASPPPRDPVQAAKVLEVTLAMAACMITDLRNAELGEEAHLLEVFTVCAREHCARLKDAP